MTVRMRHTRAHSANRRSHHALKGNGMSTCANCAKMKMSHRACGECGFYKGNKAIDMVAKVEKKQKKTAKK